MPIRLRHDVRTIEGVVTASGNSAGLDDPTFRTFGSPRGVSMMAVTGFWVRIVDWDGGAPAGVPQTLVAVCDKAYTRSGSSLWVTPNGVRRPGSASLVRLDLRGCPACASRSQRSFDDLAVAPRDRSKLVVTRPYAPRGFACSTRQLIRRICQARQVVA
jgi:hypothetical protein